MTRRTALLHLALVAIVSIVGCRAPAAKSEGSCDLHLLVGRQVHLEGRFGGPGKLADYVLVPGGEIYLFEPIDSGGAKLEYGSTVIVDGLLGYRSYPPSTEPEGAPLAARAPDHFFINNAKVRVLKPPGGAS